jgi:hypothetical protein
MTEGQGRGGQGRGDVKKGKEKRRVEDPKNPGRSPPLEIFITNSMFSQKSNG